MRYDVTQHTLLSLEAKGLGDEALRQHNELAEELLGLLAASELTDADQIERAKRAVVRQVNWQVMTDPDALMLKSKTVGIESETYRDDIGLIDTWALALVEGLVPVTEVKLTSKWDPIVSKRSP